MLSFAGFILVSVGMVGLVIGLAVGYKCGKCCGSPRKGGHRAQTAEDHENNADNIPKKKKKLEDEGAESISSFTGLMEVPQESGVWVACAKGTVIHADLACPAIKHLRGPELLQYRVCSKCTGKGRVRILKSIWHPYLCSGSRSSKEE
jgi:hypothetical protein